MTFIKIVESPIIRVEVLHSITGIVSQLYIKGSNCVELFVIGVLFCKLRYPLDGGFEYCVDSTHKRRTGICGSAGNARTHTHIHPLSLRVIISVHTFTYSSGLVLRKLMRLVPQVGVGLGFLSPFLRAPSKF